MMQSQNKQALDPPILVIGYMHSGTTLLQQIMGRHKDVLITGGETGFFINYTTTLDDFPDLDNDETLYAYVEYLLKVICTTYTRVNYTDVPGYVPVDLADFDVSPADVDDLFQVARSNRSHTALYPIAFDFLTSKWNKKRWFDKLAGYVSQLDEMLAVVPDAQVIELVRDPRDILSSKKRRAAKGGSYDPIWDSLAWKTEVRAGNKAHQDLPGRLIRIRYEDLVTMPEATIKRICQFLNLEYDENMLSVGWINSTTMPVQEGDRQIGTAAVGKWKGILPKPDAAACQWMTKTELQKNSYELESISPLVYFTIPLLALRSGVEFFVRLYDKWQLGGPSHVRSVFTNYRIRLAALLRS